MEKLTPISKEAVDLFLQCQIVLSEIETNGIKIDVPYLKSIMETVQSDIVQLERQMYASKEYAIWRRMFGGKAKLTSRHQLGDVLFGNLTAEKRGTDGRYRTVNVSKRGNLGYECTMFTETGKPEISEESLVLIDLPFVKDYVTYMSLQKVLGTSLKGIYDEVDSEGFLHPSFNLNAVQTYRSSCLAKGSRIMTNRNDADSTVGIPIENVRVGDDVYCFDDDLKPRLCKVLWAGKTGHKNVVRVHFQRHGGVRGYLDVTPEHLLRMADGCYVSAKDVTSYKSNQFHPQSPLNRSVLSMHRETENHRILYVEELPDPVDVYDIHVEEFHNFIANEICVHNSDSPNFQNLPARNERLAEIVRRCFIARGADRHFVELDFVASEVRCLSEDNLVATIDGDQTIAEVVRRVQNNEKVYVYSWDSEKNRIAVHPVVNGWKTGIQREVWEVVLDNGEVVKATENHLFMLRDGTYCRLDGLQVGDSLMPFYRDIQKANHASTHIVDVRPAGKADVYDIEVATVHNFALAAGVIVHNCAAAYHNDPAMLRYLNDKSTDMHRDMAAQSYKLPVAKVNKAVRNVAKGNFVFAAFYGASWKSMADALWSVPRIQQIKLDDGTLLSDHLESVGFDRLGIIDADGVPEPGSFYEHIKEVEHDFWTNRFAVYGQWKRDTWYKYLQDGYIDYLSGFRCAGVFPRNEVLNMPIQGLSCHCLLWSLIQINKGIKKYGWKTVLIGQIHDSIVADVSHDELDIFLDFVRHVMTKRIHKHWGFLSAPMEIEAEVAGLGETWFDKKPFELQKWI